MSGFDDPGPGGAVPGDWLVVPGELNEHRWRWGRIAEVLASPDGVLRYRLRWVGDVHDSVVVAPQGARIEKGARLARAGRRRDRGLAELTPRRP